LCLCDGEDERVSNCRGGSQADGLIGSEASLAEEVAGAKQSERRFLTLLGKDAELHCALLNVEDRVGALSLREDGLFRFVVTDGLADADAVQEGLGIERPGWFQDAALRGKFPTRWHENS